MLIFLWLMSHEQISILIAFDHDSAICLRHSYELRVSWTHLKLLTESREILNGSRDRSILVNILIVASICLKIVNIDIILLNMVPLWFLNWIIDTKRWLKLRHLLWANVHLVLMFRSFKYLIRWIASHVSISTLHQFILRRLVYLGRRVKLQLEITLRIRMLVVDVSTHCVLVGLLGSVIKLVILVHLPKLELWQLLI